VYGSFASLCLIISLLTHTCPSILLTLHLAIRPSRPPSRHPCFVPEHHPLTAQPRAGCRALACRPLTGKHAGPHPSAHRSTSAGRVRGAPGLAQPGGPDPPARARRIALPASPQGACAAHRGAHDSAAPPPSPSSWRQAVRPSSPHGLAGWAAGRKQRGVKEQVGGKGLRYMPPGPRPLPPCHRAMIAGTAAVTEEQAISRAPLTGTAAERRYMERRQTSQLY
jgi:hypothetical protein